MQTSVAPTFRHRENPDGSWDSICMRCYLTAAHSYSEEPLGPVEANHHCDEASWILRQSTGSVSRPSLRDWRSPATEPSHSTGAQHFTLFLRSGRPSGLR